MKSFKICWNLLESAENLKILCNPLKSIEIFKMKLKSAAFFKLCVNSSKPHQTLQIYENDSEFLHIGGDLLTYLKSRKIIKNR